MKLKFKKQGYQTNAVEAVADWATLGAADAIIMGSPTYMGSVSCFDLITRSRPESLVPLQ